jgi:hypothetical protein
MAGEEAHVKGFDGVRRAKLWLEGTMRISCAYANTDSPAWAKKLTLHWPQDGKPFSFDLGGILRGESYDGEHFSAEVKNYENSSDQGAAYRRFLAMCYLAVVKGYTYGDHFMWITWAPFSVTSWPTLTTPAAVVEAVVEYRARLFGNVSKAQALAMADQAVIHSVAERIWLIVLSRKQETLMPLDEWRAIVAHEIIKNGGTW